MVKMPAVVCTPDSVRSLDRGLVTLVEVPREPPTMMWVFHVVIPSSRTVVLRANCCCEIMTGHNSDQEPFAFPHSLFEINIVSNYAGVVWSVLHPPKAATEVTSGPVAPPFPTDSSRPAVVVSISHVDCGSDLTVPVINFEPYWMAEFMFCGCPPIPIVIIENCEGVKQLDVFLVFSIVNSEVSFELLVV